MHSFMDLKDNLSSFYILLFTKSKYNKEVDCWLNQWHMESIINEK